MGVTYKLTDEIVDFIVAKKRANRRLGVRKLADQVMEHFSVKVSKSSVSNVLKEADLNSPTGRKPGPSKPTFQIPEEKKQQWRENLPRVVENPLEKASEAVEVEKEPKETPAPVMSDATPEAVEAALRPLEATVPLEAVVPEKDPERFLNKEGAENQADRQPVDWCVSRLGPDTVLLEDAGLCLALAFWRELCPPEFWKMVLPSEWTAAFPRDVVGEAWLCARLAECYGGLRNSKRFCQTIWGVSDGEFRKFAPFLKPESPPMTNPARVSVAAEQMGALCWNIRVHLKNGKEIFIRPDAGEISAKPFEEGGLPLHCVIKWVTDELIVPIRPLDLRKVAATGFDPLFFAWLAMCAALPGYEIASVELLDENHREWALFDQIMSGPREYRAGIAAETEAGALLRDELSDGQKEKIDVKGCDLAVDLQPFAFNVEHVEIQACITRVQNAHESAYIIANRRHDLSAYRNTADYLLRWGRLPEKAAKTLLPHHIWENEGGIRWGGEKSGGLIDRLIQYMSQRVLANATEGLSVEGMQKMISLSAQVRVTGDSREIIYDFSGEPLKGVVRSTIRCLNATHVGTLSDPPWRFYVS